MNLRVPLEGQRKTIFLVGEGPNELGSWFAEAPYQNDDEPGVLKTLLENVKNNSWQIVFGQRWSKIKKYKAGGHRSAEEKSVLGACLKAHDLKCKCIVFSRDSDGKSDRITEILRGIEFAKQLFTDLEIIGGCAVPCIEGWVLAINGLPGTEKMSKSKAISELHHQGIDEKNTQQMVASINKAGIKNITPDATLLLQWVAAVRELL